MRRTKPKYSGPLPSTWDEHAAARSRLFGQLEATTSKEYTATETQRTPGHWPSLPEAMRAAEAIRARYKELFNCPVEMMPQEMAGIISNAIAPTLALWYDENQKLGQLRMDMLDTIGEIQEEKNALWQALYEISDGCDNPVGVAKAALSAIEERSAK